MSRSALTNPNLLHLPADLVAEVDALCEANLINRTEFIIIAIKLYLELYGYPYTTGSRYTTPRRHKPVAADDDDEPVLLAAEDD